MSKTYLYALSVETPGGILAVSMTRGGEGGQMELQFANPKKYISLKLISTQKNTRLKYLNIDLFNQTDFKT